MQGPPGAGASAERPAGGPVDGVAGNRVVARSGLAELSGRHGVHDHIHLVEHVDVLNGGTVDELVGVAIVDCRGAGCGDHRVDFGCVDVFDVVSAGGGGGYERWVRWGVGGGAVVGVVDLWVVVFGWGSVG